MKIEAEDIGLIALREIEGKEDITQDNIKDYLSRETALRIVRDIIYSGNNNQKYQALLSLLKEHHGPSIDEIYGHELKCLKGNC